MGGMWRWEMDAEEERREERGEGEAKLDDDSILLS
jgi:hypothetical protein